MLRNSTGPAAAGHMIKLSTVAHALAAPLCALEVVLAARASLPEAQAELLEAAVVRLRELVAEADVEAGAAGQADVGAGAITPCSA